MRVILLRTLSVVGATYAAILLTAVGVDGQTPARSAASAASWSTPRTPWGDPDFQGIYNSNDNVGVPVERPARFGTRTTLTDEEFAERQKEGERAARDDKSERRARGPEETGGGPDTKSFTISESFPSTVALRLANPSANGGGTPVAAGKAIPSSWT